MTDSKFATSKEAREAGWHSRRHETNAAQIEARERYQANARPAAKIARKRKQAST